jgi:Cof subfamily protein (haloacid dehalogenase superfamily)
LKYKSLLLDVDGTLVPVGPNSKPSEKVTESLRRARKKASVSLVSGRSIEWLEELFRTLDLSDPCIINGGSQIIHPKTREILWERPIDKERIQAIFEIIDSKKIPFIVSDAGLEFKDPPQRNFSKPLAIKLTYFDSKEESDLCLKELFKIPSISAHKVYSWDTNRNYKLEIYITHQEATKEQAARELAKILNVDPSEMIGVGDARNDVPLLNVCGLKVAMGNADDKLKRVAHYIAPSVEEDGVAHVVDKFIINEEDLENLGGSGRSGSNFFNKLVNFFSHH